MEITENESQYLKFIYRKQNEGSDRVKTTKLADYLHVKPATVTEALQKLAEKNLLEYNSYRGVNLTREGIETAQNLLRKHRVLETLFVKYLGLNPEEACDEAVKLDYHTTKHLANSICQTLDHPKTCPCGKEIFKDEKCKEDNENGRR